MARWPVFARQHCIKDYFPFCLFKKKLYFINKATVAHQAPLSLGFPRQEYWSEWPFPSPGDLPDPGIEPVSPALAGGFFTAEPAGKPTMFVFLCVTDFALRYVLQVYPCCCRWQNFIFLNSCVVFHYIHIHTTSSLSVHLLLSAVL